MTHQGEWAAPRKWIDTCDLQTLKIEDIKHAVPAVRPAWLQLVEMWKDENGPDENEWRDEILSVLGYGTLKNPRCWDSAGVYLVADYNGPSWIKSGIKHEGCGCTTTVVLHLDIKPAPGSLPPNGFTRGCSYVKGGMDDLTSFQWIFE